MFRPGANENPMANPEVYRSGGKEEKAIQYSLSEVLPHASGEQRAIIDALPDNLVEDMHAHLHNTDIENVEHGNNPYLTREDQLRVLRGELFERIIQAHPQEFFGQFDLPVPDPENNPEKLKVEGYDEDDHLENELLGLLHDPERFDIPRGKYNRNPDLVFTDVRSNQVRALGEAKLGKINSRAYRQLTSFEDTLHARWAQVTLAKKKANTEALNEIKAEMAKLGPENYRKKFEKEHELEETTAEEFFSELMKEAKRLGRERFVARHGLSSLAEIEKLRIPLYLPKVLVVPSNKEVPSEARANSEEELEKRRKEIAARLMRENNFSHAGEPSEFERCRDLLAGDEVLIIKAKFSGNEVHQMAEALLDEIEKRYPKSNS